MALIPRWPSGILPGAGQGDACMPERSLENGVWLKKGSFTSLKNLSCHLKRDPCLNGKLHFSNHPFSGDMLVSGRVCC